ncbi:MAG: DNA-binding protein [Alphaproteobacteria bacterium]|nr:DNA-binding protein [Alphaproteobacteria bacterium]
MRTKGLSEVVEEYVHRYYSHTGEFAENVYDLFLAELEKPLIKETLLFTQGNRKKTAEILGLNKNTLLSKMRKYDLDCNYDPSVGIKPKRKSVIK